MNDNDDPVNDQDQTATLSPADSDVLSERIWGYDFTTAEDRPADIGDRLVSWKFISAALRRSAWFWCVTAIAGLLAGIGLTAAIHTGFRASTTLLITPGPFNSSAEIGNDLNIAQSRTVAALAVHRLRLNESVGSFLKSYTVAQLPQSEMLLITASAPSSSEAVSRANAVATAFLRFRAGQLESEQALTVRSLEHEVSQASQHIRTLGNQISHLLSRPASPTQRAELGRLRNERNQATADLQNFGTILTYDKTNTSIATTSAIKESTVLDAAAPITSSSLKRWLLYPGAGLLLGLFFGMGIVIVQALISDGLRKRDDIAHALGAPVKLSIGPVRRIRWLAGRSKRMIAHDADVQRIAAHLDSAVRADRAASTALAVVPIGEAIVAALSLVSVAASHVQQGKQVVLADLCKGAPGARLLGVRKSGVHALSAHDTKLIVAVPGRHDVAPTGPRAPRKGRSQAFGRGPAQPECSSFTEEVTKACASADLLLTLTALDPSLGGEHLLTWAADAVVVVTAGRSSWAKIHAVGEMIRLAGMRLVSAVLIGADRDDESLGVAESVLSQWNASDG